MAYILYPQNGSGVGTTGSNATATYSATPYAGDLLIACVGNATNTSVPMVSDSNGDWTLLASDNITVAGQAVAIYATKATATQPTTISTNGYAISAKTYLNVNEFRGNPSTVVGIIDASASKEDSTAVFSTSGLQPSVTTTNNGDLILSVIMLNSANSSVTPSGSYTSLFNNSNLMYGCYLVTTSTGSYNPYFSWSTNTRKFQQVTVALFPAGGVLSSGSNLMSMGVG